MWRPCSRPSTPTARDSKSSARRGSRYHKKASVWPSPYGCLFCRRPVRGPGWSAAFTPPLLFRETAALRNRSRNWLRCYNECPPAAQARSPRSRILPESGAATQESGTVPGGRYTHHSGRTPRWRAGDNPAEEVSRPGETHPPFFPLLSVRLPAFSPYSIADKREKATVPAPDGPKCPQAPASPLRLHAPPTAYLRPGGA